MNSVGCVVCLLLCFSLIMVWEIIGWAGVLGQCLYYKSTILTEIVILNSLVPRPILSFSTLHAETLKSWE